MHHWSGGRERHRVVACHSAVVPASAVVACLLAVRRHSHGCLSSVLRQTGCHARHLVGCRTTSCVLLDWLDTVNGPLPYASIVCIARYPSAAHAWLALFRPIGQVRARAKVSCIQFKTRQGNFRSAPKEVVLILVWYYCVYVFIECV